MAPMIDGMLDLLVVGGLTIDHFADGTSAPGGSAIHSSQAAAEQNARIGVVTVCGEEPEAQRGLERLASLGEVHRQAAAATVAFAHRESDGHRVLYLDAPGEPISPATAANAPRARVAVLAPIAAELPPPAIASLRDAVRPQREVALLQGWLRRLEPGRRVEPLAPSDLGADLLEELGATDAAIASTEDLEASGSEPLGQLQALRAAIGPRPIVVLTLGTNGYLIDDPAAARILAAYPRRVVTGVPTIGAGDIFGAVMALRLGGGASPSVAAEAAADGVIATLERRAAAS